MTPYLRQFYENEHMRDAVHEFFVDSLKEIAVELSFEGKPTEGIKESKETIERLFDRLEQEYGKIERKTEANAR